jgi:hypothetical protein
MIEKYANDNDEHENEIEKHENRVLISMKSIQERFSFNYRKNFLEKNLKPCPWNGYYEKTTQNNEESHPTCCLRCIMELYDGIPLLLECIRVCNFVQPLHLWCCGVSSVVLLHHDNVVPLYHTFL